MLDPDETRSTLSNVTAAEPAFAAASDGKWARRYDEFTDEDFQGFSTSPSGLQYKIIEEGFGVKPLSGQKIKAHYAGYLLNGAKFDASYDRGKPLEFQVGVGRVIKGWDEALLDMKVGEKRMLKIPSSLAYGSKGAGGVIPPDATLVFYVRAPAHCPKGLERRKRCMHSLTSAALMDHTRSDVPAMFRIAALAG